MDAQELRPGNWIQDRHGKPLQVWDICSDGDLNLQNPYDKPLCYFEDNLRHCNPIQLTGAMVKALGLREGRWKIDGGPERVSYHAGDLMLLDDWTTGLQIAEHFYIVGQRPYLHQLQNFYHAITGNEIQITL